jgi:hypothetical protein
VAEAPPSALDRYFYFADVRDQDRLFRYVVETVLGATPSRSHKPGSAVTVASTSSTEPRRL